MRALLCLTLLLAAAASAEAQRLEAEAVAIPAVPAASAEAERLSARATAAPAVPHRSPSRFQAATAIDVGAAQASAVAFPFRAASPAAASREGSRVPAPALVGAGILGGAAGLFGGAYLGAYSGSWKCRNNGGGECDVPVVWGAILGGLAGEALGLPLAEHLAGGRRGSFLAELGATVLLSGAGLGLLQATHFDGPAAPVILVAVPVAQLAAVTWLEKRGR